MWRCRSTRVLRTHRCSSVCAFSTGSVGGDTHRAPVKLYVIAGEASGDAIGAKVIRALQRHQPPQNLEFRGIGGPLMCRAGDFASLFPMQELSVMGLLEVVPHIWRFQRRIQDTLRDINSYQPDLVLTIDSKGFTFRVLKALQASELKDGGKPIKKAHYVAPSVWAYKHRGKRDFTELRQLLDAMFTILPFEEDIFHTSEENHEGGEGRSWCHFVGHPAVEDFLEAHGAYENCHHSTKSIGSDGLVIEKVETGSDALLNMSKYDPSNLLARGRLFQTLAANGREESARIRVREEFGVPADAVLICALVGSRANEVNKSLQLVLDAIEEFKQKNYPGKGQQLYVVFPTIAAVEEQVHSHISARASGLNCRALTDLDASERLRLFLVMLWVVDVAAVAVSGTIVLETALASLPTVVIYRANRLTEWIAQRLAAVRFVSVPNLMLGRSIIPELVFSDCTAPKIAEALRTLVGHSAEHSESLQLAMAASTLTRWLEPTESSKLQPIRASDLVAKHIFTVLAGK